MMARLRDWIAVAAVAGAAGCGAADEGGASARFEPIEAPAETIAYAAAYDQLVAVAGQATVDRAAVGDVSAFVNSEATSPTAPGVFASVYYETGGLRAAVEGVRDRRPGRDANDQAGARIASAVATALTQASVSETPDGQRNSPRWYAAFAARRLDQALHLAVWGGLTERSAAGFDRALGYLMDASGEAHGLGRLIAAGDAACGTTYGAALRAALGEARPAFVAALESKGRLDSLDRLRIEAGDSPEYEAALVLADQALVAGLGTAFLALLNTEPFDAAAQAAAQGALEALVADLRLAGETTCGGEGSALDQIGRTLDAASPTDVDRDQVRCLVSQALVIESCGG